MPLRSGASLRVGETMNELGPYVTLLKPPVRVIFSGRSTLGKSTLAVDLAMERILPHVRQVFAVCPTFWQQDQLSRFRQLRTKKGNHPVFTPRNQFNPQGNVFTDVSDETFATILSILDSQQPRIPTFLFVDDAAADASTNMGSKGAFSHLAISAPHLKLTIFGCFQRLTSASVSFRDNSEAWILFHTTRMQDVDVTCDELNPVVQRGHVGREIVSRCMRECWQGDGDVHSRFLFAWRPPGQTQLHFHAGFDREIIPWTPEQVAYIKKHPEVLFEDDGDEQQD